VKSDLLRSLVGRIRNLAILGVGLLISTVSQTRQQALMSTMFFYFPVALLSGFAFPVAYMPTVIRWFTLLNPLRHYLVIVRGTYLEGIGAGILWPQMATRPRWASPRSGSPPKASARRWPDRT
jgi:ABC-type polysaccharide/polyol phosphate export permease